MKNELEMKKEYEAPEMEVVELKCSSSTMATPLLDDSCTDPNGCEDDDDEILIPIKQ